MKITNKHGMPPSLFRACSASNFDPRRSQPNVISLTRLIDPPIMLQLQRRHWDELEEDASSVLNRLLGTSLHDKIKAAQEGAGEILTEERVYLNAETFEVYTVTPGMKVASQPWYNDDVYYISMQFDFYQQTSETEGVLEDTKSTSAWSVVFDPQGKPGWDSQLNIEGYVLRKLGFPVTTIRNVLVFKDWKKSESLKNGQYPKVQFAVVPQRIWTDEEVESFVKMRLRSHVPAITMPDEELPVCTEDERWYKPGTYAVMKQGRVRSMKNFVENPRDNAKHEAEKYCENLIRKDGPVYSVEFRPGESIRCLDYCSCKNVCRFGKTLKNGD